MEPREWYKRVIGQRCVDSLKKKGFTSCYVASKEEARAAVLKEIHPDCSVGVGGSVTVRELGLVDILQEKGHVVFDHWATNIPPEEKIPVRKNQISADVFLTSANALTANGELVNVDGTGNRVASMNFGPEKTIVVCGINKIVSSIDEGLKRIREYAAPVNFKRLGVQVPCQSGVCTNCEKCTVTTIISRKPAGKPEFAIIVVGEQLGY